MAKVKSRKFYEDERFLITASDIRTPNTFYPVAGTVGRLRRDPFYAGICFAAIMVIGLIVYFDLWRIWEMIGMIIAAWAAVRAGQNLSILQLDARGFPVQLYLGRTQTIQAIFEAITEARAVSVEGGSLYDGNEEIDEK